ncbi:MAG: Pseudouridine synthase [Parcubacteria group bacterium GW2011_GWB1_43_8b]|nr:MAG: Pseudouridine synthase [Parcubacteria group bacterium GW2011_GWB1_43_8b]
MDPEIVFENEDLIVLNKPAGLLMHGDGKGESTLADWLVVNFPEVISVGDKPEERPGIVHRLDRDTSGIVLIPRNQAYFEYLKDLFARGKVQKTYLAIVKGILKEAEGRIDVPISLKPGTTKRTVHGGKMTKDAVTEYRVAQQFSNAALIEVSPKTGRTHQIRVHMASIGHPVLGDTLYGSKKNEEQAPRQMLHAHSLEFELEPGKAMKLTADPPRDFESFLEKLEK